MTKTGVMEPQRPEMRASAPGSYQPAPFQQVTRIPETEPFVLRPNQGVVAGIWGGLFVFDLALWTVLYLVLVSEDNQFRASLLAPAVITCLVPLFIWYMTASGGPHLAAGGQGLWVRTRPWPIKAVFLPWEAVASIQATRGGKALEVRSHHPAGATGEGAGKPLAVIPVRGSNRSIQETLAALAHLAAGRTWIG